MWFFLVHLQEAASATCNWIQLRPHSVDGNTVHTRWWWWCTTPIRYTCLERYISSAAYTPGAGGTACPQHTTSGLLKSSARRRSPTAVDQCTPGCCHVAGHCCWCASCPESCPQQHLLIVVGDVADAGRGGEDLAGLAVSQGATAAQQLQHRNATRAQQGSAADKQAHRLMWSPHAA